MSRCLAILAAAAIVSTPGLAAAADLTAPPAGDPHAFTAAPVPELGPSRIDPSVRAGGAADAGPMNATPFSGEVSNVLTGGQAARALNDTDPDRDPSAATQFRN
jgi:hypothetical protein